MSEKFTELTDDELMQVSGGGQLSVNNIPDKLVKPCMKILNDMKLYPTEEYVHLLIAGRLIRYVWICFQ